MTFSFPFPAQQTKSHTAELRAKPEYHKFLIGKGGGNIRKVRDSTGARIIFPTAEDKDQELITVIGTEEAVQEAQKELEELIKSLVRLAMATPGQGREDLVLPTKSPNIKSVFFCSSPAGQCYRGYHEC